MLNAGQKGAIKRDNNKKHKKTFVILYQAGTRNIQKVAITHKKRHSYTLLCQERN